MSYFEIQTLKDENAQLKRGLKRAVSMIQTLLEYREFVLFSCKCDCREKILLKGDNRYEMLIKECDFLQREVKTQREAVATSRSSREEKSRREDVTTTRRRHEERSRREEVAAKRSRQEEKSRREITTERSRHEEKRRREEVPSKRSRQEEKETKEPVPSTSTSKEIPTQPSDSKPDQSVSSTTTPSKKSQKRKRQRSKRNKLFFEAWNNVPEEHTSSEVQTSTSSEVQTLTSTEVQTLTSSEVQPSDNTPDESASTTGTRSIKSIKNREKNKAYRRKRALEAEKARKEGKPLPERYVNYLRKSAERNKKVAEESFKQGIELVKQANTSSTPDEPEIDLSEESKNLIEKAKIKAQHAIRFLETLGECPPIQSPEDLLYREVVPPD